MNKRALCAGCGTVGDLPRSHGGIARRAGASMAALRNAGCGLLNVATDHVEDAHPAHCAFQLPDDLPPTVVSCASSPADAESFLPPSSPLLLVRNQYLSSAAFSHVCWLAPAPSWAVAVFLPSPAATWSMRGWRAALVPPTPSSWRRCRAFERPLALSVAGTTPHSRRCPPKVHRCWRPGPTAKFVLRWDLDSAQQCAAAVKLGDVLDQALRRTDSGCG